MYISTDVENIRLPAQCKCHPSAEIFDQFLATFAFDHFSYICFTFGNQSAVDFAGFCPHLKSPSYDNKLTLTKKNECHNCSAIRQDLFAGALRQIFPAICIRIYELYSDFTESSTEFEAKSFWFHHCNNILIILIELPQYGCYDQKREFSLPLTVVVFLRIVQLAQSQQKN